MFLYNSQDFLKMSVFNNWLLFIMRDVFYQKCCLIDSLTQTNKDFSDIQFSIHIYFMQQKILTKTKNFLTELWFYTIFLMGLLHIFLCFLT